MQSPILSARGEGPKTSQISISFPTDLGEALKKHFKKGEVSPYIVWLVQQDLATNKIVLEGQNLVVTTQMAIPTILEELPPVPAIS